MTASAEDAIADADFNDGRMHWTISADHVLTISGTGATPDYSSSVNAPWYSYRSQIKSIVVQEGVTGLGSYALYQLNSAATVSLPDSLESIGSYCFYGCSSLKTVTVPEGVETIPYCAFAYCSALETIDLPDSVRELQNYAFNSCRSLKSIAIPEGVTELTANFLFEDCYSLQSITLPSTLMTLGGNWSFYGTKITDIYFNGTLSQWLGITFRGDSRYVCPLPMTGPCNMYINGEKLTNLTIPSEITIIPSYAFQYVNLNSVTLSYRVKEIGANAFYGSNVASVRMMDSTTTVGTNAFANCSSLKKVYYVGDQSKWSSIAWNTGNDSIIDAERYFVASLDDDVHTVSVGAVEHGSVTLSDAYCVAGDVITVTVQPELGWKLSRILVNGSEITGNSFTAAADTDYVVTAEFTFYMAVKDHGTCGSNLSWYLFENNELVISGTGKMTYSTNYAPWYNYRGSIASIVIDEGVTSIGYLAFYGCSLVKAVSLPDSIEQIGKNAFYGCTSLSNIELPAKLNFVDYSAFGSCSALSSVSYKGDISGWLRIEFSDYTGLLSNALTLFLDGEAVNDLVIPTGTTEIPKYAFSGYKGLRSVVFPESLSTIGLDAFYGCSGLDSVVLPAGITSIESYAFDDCYLTYAEFEGNAPEAGTEVFGDTGINGTVLYYHAGTSGWTSPKWNGYYAAPVEAFSEYSALDADNRNAQGILFTLNRTAKTATVGDGSGNPNNAGYYGAQKGAVIIPDTVTKDGVSYSVIGIGPNAFSRNMHVTSVSIGSGVTSVIPSAFMSCPALEKITVSENNEFYSASGGVLYDVSKLYLYVYPGGKSDASFTVPASVKTLGQYAFYDNDSLQTLTVGRNVTAIYRSAICGLSNLSEITLPFIGTRERNADNTYSYYSESFSSVFDNGYYGKNPLYGPRVWNPATGTYEYERGSLKKVTITGSTLSSGSFSGCESIEELTLAKTPEEIPYRCFSGCASLQKITFADTGHQCDVGELVLPEGIISVSDDAFSGCQAITSVTLPASLTDISSSAFSGAGLERFIVASGNRYYSTDSWGVLYNYNKTKLIQYPSCRKWPYYNVLNTATGIGYDAFSDCEKLVNLYIPNSVTNINSSAISGCPYLTLCCYLNSTAYSYALNNGLTAWYMDNKTLQGIRIYSLPEQTVQVQGQADLQGLYVVGNYQGRELQIDDYTVSYDQRTSGVKTVTVEYQGRTVTFEMVYFISSEGNIICFQCEDDLDGCMVMIAVYDGSGKMLCVRDALISNGAAQIGVSDSIYRSADHVKLFILDEDTLSPAAQAQMQAIE